jgi:signal transduction histidine kinase
VVLAAQYATGSILAPSEAALAALTELPGARDLGEPGSPEPLAMLARRHGLAAAVPVRPTSRGSVAFLLLGGGGDAIGRVRPRTLAELEASARRLALPLAAALSERRLGQLDDQVRRLDRLAALGGLTAEVVHEIRNPLVSVKTFLQLLPERHSDPEFQRSFFEVASDELRRVERLLDVVLEQARPAEPTPREARSEVGAALAAVVRLVSHRAAQLELELQTHAPEDLPPVALGGDALRQVTLNLILNALEATPSGGRVQVAARLEGESIELCFENEGPGIPPALRGRIFEPFVSTREGRAGGLGLAICHRIVTEAGGTIELEDRDPSGTRFRVTLPRGS